VTPAPTTGHQHVLGQLYRRLIEYVERHELGYVFFDVDLLFVTGQFLRPDLLYVPKGGREGLTDRGVEVAPGLVVEVMSPSSRGIDQVKKPERYRDFGVPEYWVVDAEERVIWVHAFAAGVEPRREAERVLWRPDPAVPALEIFVEEVLRRP
jgi:Uma2 family endonuclease